MDEGIGFLPRALLQQRMEEQLNNYSRILQTLNNRNSYLIIGEYTLLCFFMHYVWMKVSLVLVIGFNFVKDLDLENCFYFFVIIVSLK